MNGRLPVALKPVPGELLSSWIGRHADFYAVTPLIMLRHCLPEATSLHATDLSLSNNQALRLAEVLSTDARTVLRMSFGQAPNSAHRFIAKEPVQICQPCSSETSKSTPIFRSQLQGWRITCPSCGNYFRDTSQRDHTFAPYHDASFLGERLLDDEAESGAPTWASSLELARLLLMRRAPRPRPNEYNLWRFRVLGAIVPKFDTMLARETSFNFSPKNPILPLHIRPALLAGVAIVERAGPEMLRMLQRQTFGENRNRFMEATERLISPAFRPDHQRQLQLI